VLLNEAKRARLEIPAKIVLQRGRRDINEVLLRDT
jgi:hypothetical protein